MAPNYRHLLCPTDFSRESGFAIETAVALSTKTTTIHLLHVRQAPLLGVHGMPVVFPPVHARAERASVDSLLRRLARLDRKIGVSRRRRVQYHVRVGDPAQAILEFTRARRVDAIVIGSRGRSGLERIVLGSVATTVAKKSPVPVVLVHAGLGGVHVRSRRRAPARGSASPSRRRAPARTTRRSTLKVS